MTTTNASQTPALPATPAPEGFTMPCIRCGDMTAGVALNLAALDGEDAVRCHECDGEFSLAEVRDVIGRWSKLLVWIDSVPTFSQE